MSKATPCQGDAGRTALPTSFINPEGVRSGTTVRASRMSRRRAWVLILVHLAVFLHILHWKLEGTTLSPLEPSEAMYTLLHGTVNAGAILLLISLGATLVFGRFFCGWMCHLVALQDVCAWILKKVGVRPRPLKSRWLMWVPLLSGLYLFFIGPIGGRIYDNQSGLPEFRMAMQKSDFWETFPGPWLSILTFLIAGFVMVYLLGAKGFCTYACPYGGLFGVVDRLAPGRIRVTDACKACGHCTAACTSNVLVHREVLEYGMVVDPGCMKCLDCISVCPENALYFGFGAPALGAKHRAPVRERPVMFRFGEEVFVSLVFGLTLMILVGLPAGFVPWATSLNGKTPLLLSLGVAALSAFLAAFLVRLSRRDEVLWGSLNLKVAGRLTRRGHILRLAGWIWFLFLVNSAFVQYHVWQGLRVSTRHDLLDMAVNPQKFSLRSDPAIVAELQVVEKHFEAARSFGILSFLDLRLPARLGGLKMALGNPQGAIEDFKAALEIEPDFAPSHFDLSQAYWMAVDPERSVRHLNRAVELDPQNGYFLQGVFGMARQLATVGAFDLALSTLRGAVRAAPDSQDHVIALATVQQMSDDEPGALKTLDEFVRRKPDGHHARVFLGLALLEAGRSEEAARELRVAVPHTQTFADGHLGLIRALEAIGAKDEAATWTSRFAPPATQPR